MHEGNVTVIAEAVKIHFHSIGVTLQTCFTWRIKMPACYVGQCHSQYKQGCKHKDFKI